MIARPATSFAAPLPRVRPGTCMLTRATPSPSATMLSMSPAWCAPWSMRPCGWPPGLKWPPALDASAALQSPVSWTWKTCWLFGDRPPTSPAMCTALGPMVITCSLPLTRLPDADARLTTALCSSTGAAGSGAGAGVVLQAASPATRQAAARGAILAIRMALLLVGENAGHCAPSRPEGASGAFPAGTKLPGQGVAAQAEFGRGVATMAAGVLQRHVEQDLFHAFAGIGVEIADTVVEAGPDPVREGGFPGGAAVGIRSRARRAPTAGRFEVGGGDGVVGGERGEAPAQVLELAH